MSPTTLSGADIEALRAFARQCAQGADRLDTVRARTTEALCSQFTWVGRDADAHRAQWLDAVAPGLGTTVTALRTAAELIVHEAAQQEQASASGATAAGAGAGESGATAAGAGAAGVTAMAGAGGVPGPAGAGGSTAAPGPATAAGTAGAARDAGSLAPPPTTGPTAVADWWRHLTDAQRQQVIAAHPDWIGNTDGIPAHDRDLANRSILHTRTTALEHETTTIRGELAGLDAREATEGTYAVTVRRFALEHALADDSRQLAAAHAVQQALAAGPDRHLLTLDLAAPGQPLAAVAVGDVDTADHVAVYVPGFTTTVADDLAPATATMDRLRVATEAQLQTAGRTGTVATVAWLGYEAPQVSNVVSWGHSVAGATLAERGGVQLSGLLSGIGAARATDPHLTVIAHSYGSTTAAYAFHTVTGVDDAVFAGSPGITTPDASTLHVPTGHAFVMEASGDGVAALGRFGPDPSVVDGVTHLSTSATVMDGQSYAAVHGHTHYFDPGSTSLHNMAAVAAGLPDAAAHGRNFGPGDAARVGLDLLRLRLPPVMVPGGGR
ncbi:alpha/beta hydrolase [Microbacterium luticocti]|uniref:alpha/beta hydrolase n=1 Tax=Microbacterium luticocti TaxID=451764 RepID=UPI00040559AC|nr:alpha/beta hydrolase [Microbacterium luticocti]